MNLLLSLIYLIITFTLTILTYKKYGKYGLCILICILVIISNIETIKLIDVFGFTLSLGNITYGAIYLSTDILSEKYNEKSAITATKLSFICMIIFTMLITLFLMYAPSEIDVSQKSLETIFKFMPRITLASLTAYYISETLDAKIYSYLKKKYARIIISNNVSTIISSTIDTLIFVSIAFFKTLPSNELIELIITMCLSKWLIALLDTPFMIIVSKIRKVRELE